MKKIDNILVVDLESSCWAPNEPHGESEIIEVGLAHLNPLTYKIVGNLGWIVKPQHSTISEFCTKLTTLTQEQVDKGETLEDVCKMLMSRHTSTQSIFASWGDYDRNMMGIDCSFKRVKYPFGPRHLNVKTLFSLAYGINREVGMAEALEILKIPLEGTHHRGNDDAYNIAKILADILSKARNGYLGVASNHYDARKPLGDNP